MGASESKLVFKQGIFRLSEEKDIPADDPYWARVRFPSPLPMWRFLGISDICTVVLGAPRIHRRCLQFIHPRRYTTDSR